MGYVHVPDGCIPSGRHDFRQGRAPTCNRRRDARIYGPVTQPPLEHPMIDGNLIPIVLFLCIT